MSDIIKIGDAVLYHGDCLEILPTLDKVDAVVTDPPYGINGARAGLLKVSSKGAYETDRFADTQANLVTNVIPAIEACIERHERVVLTPGQKNIHKYPEPSHIGVFYYPGSSSISCWGMRRWQPIFYYGKDPHHGKLMPDSKYATDSDRDTDHPCPKPLQQWTWLTNRCTKLGEFVLDPFMGSGTTGVACANLGRRFVGIEIERKYFDIACERIDAAYAQGRLFA